MCYRIQEDGGEVVQISKCLTLSETLEFINLVGEGPFLSVVEKRKDEPIFIFRCSILFFSDGPSLLNSYNKSLHVSLSLFKVKVINIFFGSTIEIMIMCRISRVQNCKKVKVLNSYLDNIK